jgi:hypothetical protein
MRTGKKNYLYFYVPNHRKVTIITYESVGRYTLKKSLKKGIILGSMGGIKNMSF